MRWLEHAVTGDEAGLTVQQIVTEVLGVSRRMIQRLTRSRGISLNRRPAQLARKVRAGDVVAVRTSDTRGSELEPVAMELAVVHEDDELLVIDKPPFLLVHPVAPHHVNTLAHGVAHHYLRRGLRAKVRPVHRLDRDTSGLILIAKTAFAHQHLDRQLRARTLRRKYFVLVSGSIERGEGEVDAPIGRKSGAPSLREVRPDGDEAVTRYQVLERSAGTTAVAAELSTGRTHQIRVHMAHIGHPVVGDEAYGGPHLPPLQRQALHSWKMSFAHPRSGERIDLTAPLPADIAAVYNAMK